MYRYFIRTRTSSFSTFASNIPNSSRIVDISKTSLTKIHPFPLYPSIQFSENLSTPTPTPQIPITPDIKTKSTSPLYTPLDFFLTQTQPETVPQSEHPLVDLFTESLEYYHPALNTDAYKTPTLEPYENNVEYLEQLYLLFQTIDPIKYPFSQSFINNQHIDPKERAQIYSNFLLNEFTSNSFYLVLDDQSKFNSEAFCNVIESFLIQILAKYPEQPFIWLLLGKFYATISNIISHTLKIFPPLPSDAQKAHNSITNTTLDHTTKQSFGIPKETETETQSQSQSGSESESNQDIPNNMPTFAQLIREHSKHISKEPETEIATDISDDISPSIFPLNKMIQQYSKKIRHEILSFYAFETALNLAKVKYSPVNQENKPLHTWPNIPQFQHLWCKQCETISKFFTGKNKYSPELYNSAIVGGYGLVPPLNKELRTQLIQNLFQPQNLSPTVETLYLHPLTLMASMTDKYQGHFYSHIRREIFKSALSGYIPSGYEVYLYHQSHSTPSEKYEKNLKKDPDLINFDFGNNFHQKACSTWFDIAFKAQYVPAIYRSFTVPRLSNEYHGISIKKGFRLTSQEAKSLIKSAEKVMDIPPQDQFGQDLVLQLYYKLGRTLQTNSRPDLQNLGFRYLAYAVDRGHPLAAYEMAFILQNGFHDPDTLQHITSRKAYRKLQYHHDSTTIESIRLLSTSPSILSRSTPALSYLGESFLFGTNTKINVPSGITHTFFAAMDDDVAAMRNLGLFLLSQSNIPELTEMFPSAWTHPNFDHTGEFSKLFISDFKNDPFLSFQLSNSHGIGSSSSDSSGSAESFTSPRDMIKGLVDRLTTQFGNYIDVDQKLMDPNITSTPRYIDLALVSLMERYPERRFNIASLDIQKPDEPFPNSFLTHIPQNKILAHALYWLNRAAVMYDPIALSTFTYLYFYDYPDLPKQPKLSAKISRLSPIFHMPNLLIADMMYRPKSYFPSSGMYVGQSLNNIAIRYMKYRGSRDIAFSTKVQFSHWSTWLRNFPIFTSDNHPKLLHPQLTIGTQHSWKSFLKYLKALVIPKHWSGFQVSPFPRFHGSTSILHQFARDSQFDYLQPYFIRDAYDKYSWDPTDAVGEWFPILSTDPFFQKESTTGSDTGSGSGSGSSSTTNPNPNPDQSIIDTQLNASTRTIYQQSLWPFLNAPAPNEDHYNFSPLWASTLLSDLESVRFQFENQETTTKYQCQDQKYIQEWYNLLFEDSVLPQGKKNEIQFKNPSWFSDWIDCKEYSAEISKMLNPLKYSLPKNAKKLMTPFDFLHFTKSEKLDRLRDLIKSAAIAGSPIAQFLYGRDMSSTIEERDKFIQNAAMMGCGEAWNYIAQHIVYSDPSPYPDLKQKSFTQWYVQNTAPWKTDQNRSLEGYKTDSTISLEFSLLAGAFAGHYGCINQLAKMYQDTNDSDKLQFHDRAMEWMELRIAFLGIANTRSGSRRGMDSNHNPPDFPIPHPDGYHFSPFDRTDKRITLPRTPTPDVREFPVEPALAHFVHSEFPTNL